MVRYWNSLDILLMKHPNRFLRIPVIDDKCHADARCRLRDHFHRDIVLAKHSEHPSCDSCGVPPASDRADYCLIAHDFNLSYLPKLLHYLVKMICLVYGDRDAHNRSGDYIYACAVFLEEREDARHEPIAVEKFRGADMDSGHVLLVGECLDGLALLCPLSKAAHYRCAFPFRVEGVEDLNGYPLLHRGNDAFGMQDLRAEIGELARFLERKLRDDFCLRDYARIGSHDSIDLL